MNFIKELKIQVRLAWLNLFTEVITVGPMRDIPIYYTARLKELESNYKAKQMI